MDVCIGKNKVISNYTEEELLRIKEDLTLDNPKYAQVKKYSKYKNTRVPKYLFYYTQISKAIIVPRGYNIPFEHSIIEDTRNENTVNYPPFKLRLRDTQKKAKECYLEDTDKGLIVLPTGKGKTILGLNLAYSLRQKTLVIVHKDDLVDGWSKDCKLCFGDDFKVGIYKAKKREIGEQVTIATIQTLNRLDAETLEEFQSNFGLVILDECLAKDTLITLNDGGFKRIEDIVNNDKVLGGNVSNKFTRKSKKYVLQTSTTILEGSPTHPTWVLSDDRSQLIEKPLKDIKVGEYVPNLLKIPHTAKYYWSEEQLRFVALIQTDGHIDKCPNSKRIKINVAKDFSYYYKIFSEGVKAFISDCEVKKSYDCRGNMTLWVNSEKLKDILMNVFEIPKGKKSDKILINEQIQYAPLNSIKAYIETLFSTEGDLSLTSSSARININSCSKLFIQGLSLLLRKFSIISNYQEIKRTNKKHNNIYRLTIGGNFFNAFMDEFSLIPRKYTPYRNLGRSQGFMWGDYYMTKVTKSFLTDEEIDVYDFTTTSHSFVANGIKTHNCHHIASSSFDLLHRFNSCYKIGLSATPERADGLTEVMYHHLGDCAYKHEIQKNDKDILPVKVITQTLNNVVVDIYAKEKSKGVYEIVPLEAPFNFNYTNIKEIDYKYRPKVPYFDIDNRVLSYPRFFHHVVNDIYKEYKNGRSIICFFSQKKHVEKYEELLIERGVPKEKILLYYGDAKQSKDEMKQKAESKEVMITLATYSIATEGTNVKAWEVAFLVSSINNGKNTEQAVGRIRRSAEGKITPVKVYDYVLPNVYSIGDKHYKTRRQRYKKLGFEIVDDIKDNKGLFSRGFKK